MSLLAHEVTDEVIAERIARGEVFTVTDEWVGEDIVAMSDDALMAKLRRLQPNLGSMD